MAGGWSPAAWYCIGTLDVLDYMYVLNQLSMAPLHGGIDAGYWTKIQNPTYVTSSLYNNKGSQEQINEKIVCTR